MACGDVLSLEDLQTAKKHQIFEAEVITGKAGGVAGGATIDTATNPVTGQTQQTLPSILADLGFDVQSWTSSTGGVLASANQVFLNDTPGSLGLGGYYAWGGTFEKTVPAGTDPALPASGYIMRSSRFAGTQAREALRRSYAEAGYNLVAGSFEAGGTLVNVNDVLLQESTGKAFSGPAGTVAAGTNPSSGGGFGAAAWIDRSSAKNAFIQAGAGSVQRTSQDKLREVVSVLDFGATWDGTSHPLSERYSTLGEAKVVYPFVTALTQTLDYAALQAACNTKKTVLLPKGFARVNATVVLNNSVRIQGEGTDNINRAQTYISVDGNIALFTNKQGTASVTEMIQVHIDGLYVFYNPGTTPTTAAGNSAKIAFDFKSTIPGSSGLEMSSISNCTVHGAWAAISDTSGTYLTKWTNVWARNCRRGFAKALGTTILLDSCYTMGCVTPYEFGAVMSVTVINCAMDTSSISISGEGTGYSGLFFDNTHSINIMGFDAEGNTVTTNGGDIASLFHFKNSNAKLSGLTGVSTTLKTVEPSAAGSVAFIRTSGTSQVVIDASEDGLNATSDIAYVGSGGYAITVLAQDTSRVMAQGSKFRAPVGGTPALAPLSQGAVSWSNCLITGQVVTGYIQETSAQGLQTPCFFTARGIAALPAGVSTPMFALPNSQGAYMITVWGSSSGANYFTVYLASFDGTGTATLTVLKPAAFLTLQSSGLSISATSTGGANFNWTYTKLG